MSSILKALKRLEQEKAARRQGEIDLTHDILKDTRGRKNRFPWHWAAALTVIVILSVTVIVLMTRDRSRPAPIQEEPRPETRQQVPTLPAATSPLRDRETEPEKMQTQQDTTVTQKGAAIPQGKITGNPPAEPKSVAPLPKTGQNPVQTEIWPSLPATATPPPVLPPPAKKEAAAAPKQDPAFSVSGIAWNKDSADRLAIINGQPLTTGSFINGAVVEEILPDRVRFSMDGKAFEVSLGTAKK